MNVREFLLMPILMAAALLVVGQLYVTLPLVSDLADHWQVTPGLASWAGSSFGFAYAAGVLLLVRLADHKGGRGLMLASLCAMALASVAVAASSNFGMLLVARA